MDIIEWTLYYWYGDEANVPKHTDASNKPYENIYKYKIDIPDELYNDSLENISVDAKSGMTPWQYCQTLLNDYPLTKSEQESGLYDDLSDLSYSQRPRYAMYLNDSTNTIHITHIVPKVITNSAGEVIQASESSLLSIDKFKFYWGMQSGNIVTDWKPSVDTKLYLIRKALKLRYERAISTAASNGDTDTEELLKSQLTTVNDELIEQYDAQLDIIGIPSDIPLGIEITVIPTILETQSRTAGIYTICSATDTISSNGLYTTSLNLFRLRGLSDTTLDLTSTSESTGDTASTTSLEVVSEETLPAKLYPSEGGIAMG
jgi:hypothetical protein